MRIRHERPDPGLSFLVTAPLLFWPDTSEEPSDVQSWSLDGVRFAQDMGHSGPGHLRLPFQGVYMDLPVYLNDADEMGLHTFREMTVRQREVLTTLYQGLLTGQMTTTTDMIQSLDTPVDKVPMSETSTEQAEATQHVAPRLMRMARTLMTYGIVAAVLIIGMGGKIWQRLDQLTPTDARVAAPMVPHFFGEPGQVSEVLVEPGAVVDAGHVLVEVRNADLDRQTDAVRAQIRLVEQRLEQAVLAHAQQAELLMAQRAPLVDAFMFAHRGTQIDLSNPVVQATRHTLSDYDLGIGMQPGDVRAVTELMETRVAELDTDLKFARRELGDLKAEAEAGNLRAQVAGVVQEVHVGAGMGLRAQSLGVTLEEQAPRTIVGFLSDRHADQVYIGMPAQVSLRVGPASKTVDAQVLDFRLVARGNDGQGAAQSYALQVEVAVLGLTTEECAAMLRPDAPVRLRLYRETSKRLRHHVLAWIGR